MSHFSKNLCFLGILFLSLFVITPGGLCSELEITSPKLTLTGIKTDFNVSGIDFPADKPLIFKVLINGKVATSGVSLPENLNKIVLHFQESGTNKVDFQIGQQSANTKVRCLPGWTSLLPPLFAIILALITREVISSLFLGVWFGATLIFNLNPFVAFLRALDKYILGSLADSGHASIVIFSLMLGGMVGIINRTGGMQGIVELIFTKVKGPRSAQFFTWLMGVLIFFDDYANTLIVGNSMRPVTDKNKISREKLSYIVDSTAAPVAGIAVLSTWIGFEIGLIRQAFLDLGIAETNFYSIFLQTIPFRFYCILALFFVLAVCLTRRDFGPMLDAETRAYHENKPLADDANPISSSESAMQELPEDMPKRWYNAAIPIAIVIFGTFLGLLGNGGMFDSHYNVSKVSKTVTDGYTQISISSLKPVLNIAIASSEVEPYAKYYFPKDITGNQLKDLAEGQKIWVKTEQCTMDAFAKIRTAFADADSTQVLIWVSSIGAIVALLLGIFQGLIVLETGVRAWIDGVRAIMMAICLMLLAWSINSICTELNTANYIVEMVTDVIPYWLLPSIIFILACLISFSTGTSWGTMAILLPITIPLAYHLNMKHYNEVVALSGAAPAMAVYLKQAILVSIGAVLEGSIFGDHCSPISDTTIMSSMASGSDHIDHVKTQAPYAAIVGLTAILFCYIPAGLGISPFLLIPFSAILLLGFLLMFGKDPAKNKAK